MFQLKSELSLISLNARGLRDITKRKRKNANVIFLQETHSKTEDCNFWSKQWGDKAYFCHGSSRSAGVAVLLKNFQGQIISHYKDQHGHWLILVVNFDTFNLVLINVYGYNNLSQNKFMLEDIAQNLGQIKQTYSTNNIIIGGDFNLVQDNYYDKWPSKYSMSHPNITFNTFCNEQHLMDIWRHLNPGTIKSSWFSSTNKSRLDYWLVANELLTNDIHSDISNSSQGGSSWRLKLLDKLDKMNIQKAEGAFVRSRAKWIEEGEKKYSLFL
uniref:exodeoxyribonuclease III n=1 Tax=Oryzias melastigma TaxID=30732 RepID=A0A3B3BQT6_ORYME